MNRFSTCGVALLLPLFFALPAASQNRAALTTQNTRTITTNGRGAITGSVLDNMLQNIINGSANQSDVNAFTGNNTHSGSETFTGIVTMTPPLSITSGGSGSSTSDGAAANLGVLPHVANTTALQAVVAATGAVYVRDGQFAALDGGQANYSKSPSTCSLHSGAGDSGSQIPAAGGGCWLLQAQYQADIRVWPVVFNNTCTSTGAPPTLVTSASGFDDGPPLRDALAWATANGAKIVFPGNTSAGNSVIYLCSQDPSGAPGALVAGRSPTITTTAAQTTGDTQITVSSVSGITANATEIGVLETNGAIQTKLVTAISTNTLTISALAAPVASGANVWVYGVNGGSAAKSWAVEAAQPIGSPLLGCGFSMPYIKIANNFNLPIIFDHADTVSPTLTNICWGGNRTQQTGWAGGPGGKLYIIQMNDDPGGFNENTMVFHGGMVENGYNGGVYQGFGRGHVNAYDLTVIFNGTNTTDYNYAELGYDSYFSNPEFGSTPGVGFYVGPGGGAQIQVIGGGIFNSQIGVEVAGGGVNNFNMSTTQINSNVCGGIVEDNVAASNNAAGHVYTGITFSDNSTSGVGLCSDVKVAAGSMVSLNAPIFEGGHTNATPKYNIDTSGQAQVNVSSPTFATTTTPFSTAFTDNSANLNCGNCLSASGTPLTPLFGTTALLQSATQFNGLTLTNGSNQFARLFGNNSNNDGGKLVLAVFGSPKVSFDSTGFSYINSGSLSVGATSTCANNVQICATGSDSNTTGTMNLGTSPTISGSCASGTTATGGNAAGTFTGTSACTAGTIILTFAHTAPNGWNCITRDRTTPADSIAQTASTTTTATLTGTTAANDVVQFQCTGY